MRIVADKAIAFIKNWLEIPDRTPGNLREQQAIAGYKIVKEIGAGGYGRVFLAETKQHNQIAIKVMLAEVAATPAKVRMFEREIDNAKVLNHPNIVRLTDNGFDKEGWEVLLDRDVVPIRDRNPDLPSPLATVINRALQEGSSPSSMLYYQRVRDFKTDLAKAFQDISL